MGNEEWKYAVFSQNGVSCTFLTTDLLQHRRNLAARPGLLEELQGLLKGPLESEIHGNNYAKMQQLWGTTSFKHCPSSGMVAFDPSKISKEKRDECDKVMMELLKLSQPVAKANTSKGKKRPRQED